MKLLMKGLVLAFLLHQAQCGPYVPGTAGAQWTSEEAAIIRNKIQFLWRGDQMKRVVEDFDFKNPKAKNTDYIYEPDRRLTKVDCQLSMDQCATSWNKYTRQNDIAFSPTKAIRLAFHDCQPYKDGTGGCDGCLNFEENVEENDMLQHTAGILEKVYLEKDFPKMKGPQLNASPRDLGISRADFWSFVGLLGLDEVSRQSRAFCETFNYNLTCGDFEPCFAQFPAEILSHFKTGRADCEPSKSASKKQGYLAPLSEDSPHAVASGPQTVAYFKEKFNLDPKEGLALMGAHTVGRYSTFHTHIDYAWVRKEGSQRTRVFNNEYYKTLAARPAHVKDKYCVGAMDGGPAKADWHVFANLFEWYWPQNTNEFWTKRSRRLLWHPRITRAPNCQAADEDSVWAGMQTPWIDNEYANALFKPTVKKLAKYAKSKGFKSMYEYCCKMLADGCGQNGKEPCDLRCEQSVQNRVRHLSADVGFYLKFDFDKRGLPIGCKAFDRIPRHRWGWYYADEIPGPAQCEKQDMIADPKTNQKMFEAVEEYADDINLWLKDFVAVWAKMNTNGNENLKQGPTDFWTSRCCIHSSVYYDVGPSMKKLKAGNALECQAACRATRRCNWFVYNSDGSGMCKLKARKPSNPFVVYHNNNWLGGPPSCPTESNECEGYKTML